MNAKSSRKFSAELKERTQAVQQSKRTPTPSEIVNYLLKAGTDYKGQFNYAFQPIGISSTFGFGIDVFKLAGLAVGLPFLPVTLKVNPKVAIQGARYRLLAVEYQNDQTPGFTDPTPLALEDMRGATGTVTLGLGITIGPQWNPTADIPGLEQLGFAFSIGVTGSTAGTYEGTVLRVWDPTPTYYRRDERASGLTADVRALLAGRDRKGARRPSDGGYNPLCSFTTWTQTGEGIASIDAAASAKATLADVGSVSFSATANGPKVDARFSWSASRLQTVAANKIVMTQDSELSYKKVSTHLIDVGVKAEAVGTGHGKPKPLTASKDNVLGLAEKTTKVYVNALAYRSGVLYWNSTAPLKRADAGSGLQRGHSVSIQSLKALIDGTLDETRQADFVLALATSLKIDAENLWKFFTECKDLIASLALDSSAQPDALFVEATFLPASILLDQLFKPGAEEPSHFLDTFEAGAPRLETIRLRYRIGDKDATSHSLLKLGFTWTVDIKFELSEFEQYGSGGWVDLHVTSFSAVTVQPAILIS